MLLLVVLAAVGLALGDPVLHVSRKFSGEGHHKTMLLEASISAEHLHEMCPCSAPELALFVRFPKELFVDPYQLKQHHNFGGPLCLVAPYPDLEVLSSSAKARPIDVFASAPLMPDPSGSTFILPNFTLPFHLRYQLAAHPCAAESEDASLGHQVLSLWARLRRFAALDAPMAPAVLGAARLLLRCPCAAPGAATPLRALLPADSPLLVDTPQAQLDEAAWRELTGTGAVDVRDDGEVQFAMPVGNLAHSTLVQWGTYAFLWATTLFLVMSAVRAGRSHARSQKKNKSG